MSRILKVRPDMSKSRSYQVDMNELPTYYKIKTCPWVALICIYDVHIGPINFVFIVILLTFKY